MKELTVLELKDKLDNQDEFKMIDVREPHEYEADHLENTLHIPLNSIPGNVADLEEYKDHKLVMICRSGNRCGTAANFLNSNGFKQVYNLKGGMLAWKAEIDESFNVQ